MKKLLIALAVLTIVRVAPAQEKRYEVEKIRAWAQGAPRTCLFIGGISGDIGQAISERVENHLRQNRLLWGTALKYPPGEPRAKAKTGCTFMLEIVSTPAIGATASFAYAIGKRVARDSETFTHIKMAAVTADYESADRVASQVVEDLVRTVK